MRARPLAFVLVFLFVPIAQAQAQSSPSISSVSLQLGAAGQPITISGSGFGATQGTSFVTFGSASASVSSWSDSSITAAVPSSLAAGNVNIIVTANGSSSNAVSFLVIPVITGLSTYSASSGTQVTISGSGFDVIQGASTIMFNGISALASSWGNSTIVTSVPTGASTGPLTVTVNSIATNSVTFTVPTPPPTVTSLSPGVGPIGSAVIITGANFGDTQGSSRVLFSVGTNQDTGDTVISALTGDGQQLWTTQIPGAYAGALADANGGLIVNYFDSNTFRTPVVDLDGQTGARIWQNDTAFFNANPPTSPAAQAIASDGTVLVGLYTALDPKTGAVVSSAAPVNTPQGLLKWSNPPSCDNPTNAFPTSSPLLYGPFGVELIGPSVTSDGTRLQTIGTLDLSANPCSQSITSVKLTLYLSQSSPDGSATFTPFHTETSLIPDGSPLSRAILAPGCHGECPPLAVIPPFNALPNALAFRDIPDGQGGALVPWWKDLGNQTYEAHVTHVSSSGVSEGTLPLTYQNVVVQSGLPCPLNPGQLPCNADFRLVLGENGVAFATDLKSVVAFDIASLSPLWTYSSASGMDLVAATADGGVTINDFMLGLTSLNSTGSVGPGQSAGSSMIIPRGLGEWIGEPGGALAEFAGPPTLLADSYWPLVNGAISAQNSSPERDFELIWCANGGCSDLPDTNQDLSFFIQADDATPLDYQSQRGSGANNPTKRHKRVQDSVRSLPD